MTMNAPVKPLSAGPFPALAANLQIGIEGMTCASCVRRVEKAIAAVPGVAKASVNLATERATVRRAAGSADSGLLVKAAADAGYEARAIATDAMEDAGRKGRDAEIRALARSLGVAVALTLPIFILEMGSHLVPSFHHWVMVTLGAWNWRMQFVLTTLVLFGPGLRFFGKGIPALLKGAPA